MPWSNKSVSPSTYTPVAGESGLSIGTVEIDGILINRLSVVSSKIAHLVLNDKAPSRVAFAFKLASGGLNRPPGDIPTKIHIFRTVSGAWLICHYSGIHRSVDGRKTWTQVYSSPCGGAFFQIDNGRIFCNSAYSDNDGLTWTGFFPLGSLPAAVGICRSGTTGTIIRGLQRGAPSNNFTMSRSADNGTSWSTITVTDGVSGPYYDPWSVFCSQSGVFLVGTQTYTFISTDDGATFRKTGTQTRVMSFFQCSDGTLYSICDYNLHKSIDDGISWSLVGSSVGLPTQIFKELSNSLFLVGSFYTNPARIWSRLVSRADHIISIPGSLQLSDGMPVNSGSVNCCDPVFSHEYDGTIYTPIILAPAIMGVVEIDLKPITTAYLPEFQPTSPAKLSEYSPITITLDSTGSNGTVTAYIEHYNDIIGSWASLTDVLGQRTSLGIVTSGSPISLPSFSVRAGEKFRMSLDFQSSDGISPAPAFVSASVPWASDVSAPDNPSIVSLSDSSKGTVGYRLEVGVPENSRHVIVEGKVNGSEYLPFSKRAKFESGFDHMQLRGHVEQIEASGERNENHIDFRTGLSINDEIQVKIAAEDSVGNRSAFVESSVVKLEGATYVPVFTTNWREVWATDNWRVVWNR